MTLTDVPLGGDCPENIRLLRSCSVCHAAINRLTDRHCVVTPSWQRCNDIVCADCWLLLLRAMAVAVAAVASLD